MCTHFNDLHEANAAMQASVQALDERLGMSWPHHIDASAVEQAHWAGERIIGQINRHYGTSLDPISSFTGRAKRGLAPAYMTSAAWPPLLKELCNEREQVAV